MNGSAGSHTAPPGLLVQAPIALDIPGRSGYALRRWRDEDAPALSAICSEPEVWRWMSDHFPFPYTLEHAQAWVRRGHDEFGGVNLAVTRDDEAIGGAGVHPLQGPARCNAEIGYYLHPQQWRQGVGTAVVRALLHLALQQPQVTRVFAPIHAGNDASAGVLRKNGFVREGRQRLAAMKAGQAIDTETWAFYCEPAVSDGP